MHTGAIMFDYGNSIVGTDRTIVSIESAWASIAGGTARRVTSVHELPSDVIWYTNLPYAIFDKAGLSKHANFRNSDWMRSKFYNLVSELGVDVDNVSPQEAVSAIASIAARVAVVAQDQYGVTIRDRKLNYDFATALGAPRSGMQDGFYPIISPIAQHAQVNCIKNINFGQNSPSITLRRNRLQHARELLETPLPVDYDWELESPVSLRKHGDNWLESVDTPFLVKCSVTNVIPLFAEILSWNSGTGTSKAPREWLTDLEWRVIRQYAEVAVSGALICKRPAERLSAYERLPNAHAAELSTTYGLVAEQIWTAFTNPAPYRGGETRFTAAAAWLRAADRMRMFEYAQRVHSRGLDVQSYGVGQVVVRYPPSGALNRTLAIAADCGLLAPVSKFAEGRKHAR